MKGGETFRQETPGIAAAAQSKQSPKWAPTWELKDHDKQKLGVVS